MESRDFIWNYWSLLKEANETKDVIQESLGKQYNLTQLQFNVLAKVEAYEDKSISALARSFQKDHGNISKICTVLEEKGYIYREKSAEDNRVVFLYLTDQGRKYREEFNRCVSDSYEKLNKVMTLEEQRQFFETMRFVNDCFSNSEIAKEQRKALKMQRREKTKNRK